MIGAIPSWVSSSSHETVCATRPTVWAVDLVRVSASATYAHVHRAQIATLNRDDELHNARKQFASILRGPWLFSLLPTTLFEPPFNADGTFTAIIMNGSGVPIGTDAGTWLLTPPNVVQVFGNPQAHLTFTNNAGVVLLSADILEFTIDSIGTNGPSTGIFTPPSIWVGYQGKPG